MQKDAFMTHLKAVFLQSSRVIEQNDSMHMMCLGLAARGIPSDGAEKKQS